MIFNRNDNLPVIALLGAGSMGTAIVRRIANGKRILLGDISEASLESAARDLTASGYAVETQQVDALDRASVTAFAARAASLGEVRYLIDTAGTSPNQSSPEHIVALDLVATAMAIDIFAEVIAPGGAGLIISSQAGHMMRLSDEVEQQLALTPTDELADLDVVKHDAVTSSGMAYMVSKRANHLRVRTAAATTWGDRGARINSISPGIVVTPLAYDEFRAAGEGYQAMIDASPARRVGSSDEIAAAAAFLLSDEASFITGTDLLIDGGVIAAIGAGRYTLGG
ncbi:MULTISPECIES: SDR family oxidoreductase [unclassified Actinomyces]|uniref:SDR family oxidoreductase n=1 Tax=unclassified Actinomyces TaxID=2609248 RepID=UPI0020181E90|nr:MULTISPECIES: SDR family oxidoreductase [unclassified Actinomyces]MCL3777620.1 SDR family oxidoreductase [Actinomyces sp. AC-20-1]MCL3789440.1 SDR family oxidoreductase [Actinomyces sp. 187325]MCL3791180.1 SDR family oxidoreductase [Actinomyces sp. 186855]MCL3794426.1 SDR family oxidoreductase [Actinomyces sp. 217892]